MTEDLKGLIEKIQEEGIKAAEDKARAIENEAQSKAQSIIEAANQQARLLVNAAKAEVSQIEESAKANLKHAARDTLISLRKEINVTLKKVIVLNVRRALGPEELTKIIVTMIKEYQNKEEKGTIIVSLSKNDLDRLEHALFNELKKELEGSIVLKSSENVKAGFLISYDSGKSHYDFTDEALANYISASLEPKIGALLKDVASEEKV